MMKRLIVLTAVLCMMTSMTACASKSRRNLTLETEDVQSTTAATEAASEAETEHSTIEAPAQIGTLQLDEDLNEDLVGTWKYCVDEDMDTYYVIDSDHTMMNMTDLSELMFIKNGKLVLGEDNPSNTFSFREKNGHLVAQVEKNVILDIKPKSSADTDEVQGDFDVYDSIVLPQETTEASKEDSESDDEDDEIEELHRILRFQDGKTYLIELGGCYSTDEKLVFLTNKNQMVLSYEFDDDKNTLIVRDEDGNESTFLRSSLSDENDKEENDD